MRASLPMYDFPSVRGATDRYWHAIREALGQGPESLSRGGNVWEEWVHPDLLLSQTCGLPYRASLQGKVTLVGTPNYDLPGCGPGEYNSVLVARADDSREKLEDFDGAPFAVNSSTSQSGWAAPIVHARAQGVTFGRNVKTGAHILSALAVSDGQADIAGLDALSWHYIQNDASFPGHLKIVDHTTPTPATPYITHLDQNPALLYAAIETAIAVLSEEDRTALSLKGIVKIPPEVYRVVPTPAPPRL